MCWKLWSRKDNYVDQVTGNIQKTQEQKRIPDEKRNRGQPCMTWKDIYHTT